MPCCPPPSPPPAVRSGQTNMRVSPRSSRPVSSLALPCTSRSPLHHLCSLSLSPGSFAGPRAYPLIPLSARTTIRSADVSPSRIASEKIGLAPAPQLLGPAMLQSRELVASSWHGLGRFRVNFIRGLVVAPLHCVFSRGYTPHWRR